MPRLVGGKSKYRGVDWVGRSERLRNERMGVYPDWTTWVDTGRGYDDADYVPLSERDDWDGEVEVLKPVGESDDECK